MMLKHYIIEGFCNQERKKGLPCKCSFQMRDYCFCCPEFSFARSEHEIAYSNSEGVVAELSDWIGFGGNMEPCRNTQMWKDRWGEICRKKIQEAHEEYMQELNRSADHF